MNTEIKNTKQLNTRIKTVADIFKLLKIFEQYLNLLLPSNVLFRQFDIDINQLLNDLYTYKKTFWKNQKNTVTHQVNNTAPLLTYLINKFNNLISVLKELSKSNNYFKKLFNNLMKAKEPPI
jgi:hypothetical protein